MEEGFIPIIYSKTVVAGKASCEWQLVNLVESWVSGWTISKRCCSFLLSAHRPYAHHLFEASKEQKDNLALWFEHQAGVINWTQITTYRLIFLVEMFLVWTKASYQHLRRNPQLRDIPFSDKFLFLVPYFDSDYYYMAWDLISCWFQNDLAQ
jgi:hypothetical protein